MSLAHKAGLSLDLRKMHNGTQFLDRPRPRLWRAGAELSALDDQKRAGASLGQHHATEILNAYLTTKETAIWRLMS